MSLHSTPEAHDADPPQGWQVVKTGPRNWELRSSLHREGDGAIGYYATRKAAEADRAGGFYVAMYEKDGRWFAGQTPGGWKPYSVIVAEREARAARQAARS